MNGASRIFNQINPKKVKLLGDSITHGVGGTGFKQNGEPIVTEFKRNPDGFCWAKMFSELLSDKYSATVTNNACTGTTIEFIIEHFDNLVDSTDELAICTIGTNNRHQYMNTGAKRDRDEMYSDFCKKIDELYLKFKEKGIPAVFMANIPASEKNEQDTDTYWRILHMNDINDAYTAAAKKHGFPFISLYELFSGYCKENEISLNSLLIDGLHPNDEGYKVMFSLITRALGV